MDKGKATGLTPHEALQEACKMLHEQGAQHIPFKSMTVISLFLNSCIHDGYYDISLTAQNDKG